MKFSRPEAVVWTPDGGSPEVALSRVTHLGIGAHQDDLEIMAFHGIATCFDQPGLAFGGVTCTDGRGSARSGPFASCTDDDLQRIRIEEQNRAAAIGRYAVMIQLGHPSASVRSPDDTSLRADLEQILRHSRPRVVYTHNPADQHDTHIGVLVPALEALRSLPEADRPERVYGCEVWRDLDWLPDGDKVALDVGARADLFAELVAVFESQIAGGKRYDLATMGRARANATYHQSHTTDRSNLLWFAMDLTPLIRDPSLDLVNFTDALIGRFADDVRRRLRRRLGRG